MQKVTDPGLLAQLNGGAPAPSAPGVIMGRPKAPDPYRVEQDQIGNAQEAERLRIAQDKESRDRQKDELDIAKKQRENAAGDMGDAIEAERKAAAFLLRALGSNRDYEAQDIGPRSYIGQKMADNAPDILNTLPAGIGNSPERQIADSAQDAFIAASLRQDSGAAIPPEELERQRRIYFPMPGDTEEVIAAKKVRRDEAIAGLKMSAGRLADETIANYEQQFGGDSGQRDGATVLPTARGAKADPGVPTDGVTPKGTGGVMPVPELYGIGDAVADMIGRGASEQEVVQFLRQQYAPYGLDVSTELQGKMGEIVRNHRANPSKPVKTLATGWDMLHMRPDNEGGSSVVGEIADSPVGAATIGAADVFTGGFGDEIVGLLGGDTDATRAAMEYSRQERPYSTMTGQAAASAFLPLGKAGNLPSMARAGGGFGAVYGAGSANGDIGDRLTGAVVGGGTGALAGYVAGGATNALTSRAANQTSRQAGRNALLQDFRQQGVEALPANVGGAPTRVATAGSGQAFFSSGSIRNAVERQADQFGEAVQRNAQQAGAVLPADEAGLLARNAGQRFSKETAQRGGRLYDRAQQAAGSVRIAPRAAIRQIDDEITKLSETPEIHANLIGELEKFKASLTGNQKISVAGLRDARTAAGKAAFNPDLRSSPTNAVMGRVMDAISTDIEGGLRAAGKDRAASMFSLADRYWKERVQYIDQTLEPIIGKGRSGEDILKSVESMASGTKGGVQRLHDLMTSLSDAERGDVQATIIDRLGRATKGAQDAEGAVFSSSTFLTNWNGLSQKGKAALFGNGDLRQSLDQIARVAGSMKDAARYTNTSNTAGALGWQSVVSGGAYTAAGFPGAVIQAGGQYVTGKMLASPRFAAWLARAPKNPTASQARTYMSRLKNIATAEPVIAADVNRFAQFLNAANDASPARAVAQGQQEEN